MRRGDRPAAERKRGAPSFPIATQLILTIVSAVVASLLITGGLLASISYRSEMRRLVVSQQSLAQTASERISSYIDDLQRKLSYLARVQGISTFDSEARANLLKALTIQNQAYQMVGFTDRHGQLVQALSPHGDVPPPEWASTTAFHRSFILQEDYIGQVELEARNELPSLLMTVPVRDRRNEVDGILFARVSLKYIWAVLDEVKVGKSGYAYIVDQRGFLVAQSGELPERFRLEDISRILPEGGHVAEFGADLSPETHVYQGLHGMRVIGLSTMVVTTNWRVVVELPMAEANAPAFLSAKLFGAVFLFGLAYSVVFGLVMGRRLSRPLRQLTIAADRMRLGDLETRVVITRKNELGLVAEAFNHMASQLTEDIVQRGLTEAELKQALLEKQNLLRELQHRAKNSFNMISSLTHLASTDSSSPETLRALEELNAKIMAVSELYSLLYEAGSFDEVRLDSYCERVSTAMDGLMTQGVSFEKELENVTVPAKWAAPIGLIVTELVTNSLKYAFPEGRGGTISLSLKNTGGGVLLEVRDNGRGLPAGFDPAASSGMGLKLVQGLADQIAARFTMEGGHGGTRCVLELDLEK